MDGASSSSSCSWYTAPATLGCTYDVFLSFRGEDTRNNFVGHLYEALNQAGIYTFKDDENLQRGKPISPELLKAIEESMVSVVVFSKNYANSCWCLDELVKIIECQDSMGQRVLPVFYDVEPRDVRGQKRSFQTAFLEHEVNFVDDVEKVNRWRDALKTAANLSGWDVSRTANGREIECIKQIVRTVSSYTEPRLEENLIGMESRIRHLKLLLDKGGDDVCFIGIWGMGGIGKTTIARALYRQISYEFEGSSFLKDVRENGSDTRGLKSLQEKLLSEILMQEHFKVKDCDDGMCQIQRRLGRKKVLVVLDDVDNIEQLQFLAGARDWFGHANSPPETYKKLSGDVVSHTGLLPLAIKILGSHFRSKSLNFWKSELKVLTKTPHNDVNKVLKVSYDGLSSLQQKIFLHIACLFKGKEVHLVTRILDAIGLEAVSGITVLVGKSLLSISNGFLKMHDLIQEMGQCIVLECYPNTMVWLPEKIEEVMTTVNILEAVEVMLLGEHNNSPIVCCSAELWKSMKKLRLLEVKGSFTSSEPTYFPNKLRWLSWNQYPFDSLRITRDMTKIVGLQMMRGSLRNLQMEQQVIFPNLKYINLQGSNVTMFPSVSGAPNLEWLNLSQCTFAEVHESVFCHGKIIYLNLSYCYHIRILPSKINMKSLQTLLLNNCDRLKTFPDVSTGMEKLSVLAIDSCGSIHALPSSVKLLTGLTTLTMQGCFQLGNCHGKLAKRLSQGSFHLASLRVLDLSQNLLYDIFPSNLHTAWPSLEELVLDGNKFTRLPATISRLSHLKYLDLSYCVFLKDLPVLPSLTQVLKANGCTSLKNIEDLSNRYKWLFKISVSGCPILDDIESQSHIANMLMQPFVQKCADVNHRLSIMVPGSTIPNWFNKRDWITRSNWKVISSPADAATCADCIWTGYMSMDIVGKLCHGFESEHLFISFESFNSVIECGACVVYEKDIKKMRGIGSWISDYDELGRIEHHSATSEELQHGRWSRPSYSFKYRKSSDRDHNLVTVFV
ncbi:TMV resistance protein N-like [Bidens hawaiensis]|uniref:TMV resistance protein N-like n=1 Tax=Bidens hawaiensis TaxID=980011 RepID=UPI0040492C13